MSDLHDVALSMRTSLMLLQSDAPLSCCGHIAYVPAFVLEADTDDALYCEGSWFVDLWMTLELQLSALLLSSAAGDLLLIMDSDDRGGVAY